MNKSSESVLRLSLVGITFIFVFFSLAVFGSADGDTGAARELTYARVEAALKAQGVAGAEDIVKKLRESPADIADDAGAVPEIPAGMTPEALKAIDLQNALNRRLTDIARRDGIHLSEDYSADTITKKAETGLEIKYWVEKQLGMSESLDDPEQIVKAVLARTGGQPHATSSVRLDPTLVGDGSDVPPSGPRVISPSCWTDTRGQPLYLLEVELTRKAVLVRPAWPESHAQIAARIPGIGVTNQKSGLSYNNYAAQLSSIANSGGSKCKYYILLKDKLGGMAAEKVYNDLVPLFGVVQDD